MKELNYPILKCLCCSRQYSVNWSFYASLKVQMFFDLLSNQFMAHAKQLKCSILCLEPLTLDVLEVSQLKFLAFSPFDRIILIRHFSLNF